MSEVPLWGSPCNAGQGLGVTIAARSIRVYRGTSLIRNTPLLGPYSRNMPRALWKPWEGGLFLMSEVHVGPCLGGS